MLARGHDSITICFDGLACALSHVQMARLWCYAIVMMLIYVQYVGLDMLRDDVAYFMH